jgi:hypothetical protein
MLFIFDPIIGQSAKTAIANVQSWYLYVANAIGNPQFNMVPHPGVWEIVENCNLFPRLHSNAHESESGTMCLMYAYDIIVFNQLPDLSRWNEPITEKNSLMDTTMRTWFLLGKLSKLEQIIITLRNTSNRARNNFNPIMQDIVVDPFDRWFEANPQEQFQHNVGTASNAAIITQLFQKDQINISNCATNDLHNYVDL